MYIMIYVLGGIECEVKCKYVVYTCDVHEVEIVYLEDSRFKWTICVCEAWLSVIMMNARWRWLQINGMHDRGYVNGVLTCLSHILRWMNEGSLWKSMYECLLKCFLNKTLMNEIEDSTVDTNC